MGNCMGSPAADGPPQPAPPKVGPSDKNGISNGPGKSSQSSFKAPSAPTDDFKAQQQLQMEQEAALKRQQEEEEKRRAAEEQQRQAAALQQQQQQQQQIELEEQQRQQQLQQQQEQLMVQQQQQMMLQQQAAQQAQLQQMQQHFIHPNAPGVPAPAQQGGGGLRGVHEEQDESMWEVNVHDNPNVAPPELQEYSYQDLVLATENFQDHSVLGEGGFGKVYKGYVLDKHPVGGGASCQASVAIKKLNPSGYQSKVEWMREILVLGKLQHPNLVRLIGYCAEVEEMLLVYEFVPRGSLDYHLWPAPNTNAPPLTWQARLRIAHDAAAGLAHLHASNFIHRDFKAPNILIDENFSGKLTDFGLAKDGPDPGQTHVSTQIMGTMGYLDPRYAETGQLTVKSDVYAYGVVLLELLTGKKAMGISPGGKPKTLTSWARPLLTKGRPDLESLVDPNMLDPFPEKVARTLAISAKHCIQDDTSMRPMMSDIVDTLRPLNMAINGRR